MQLDVAFIAIERRRLAQGGFDLSAVVVAEAVQKLLPEGRRFVVRCDGERAHVCVAEPVRPTLEGQLRAAVESLRGKARPTRQSPLYLRSPDGQLWRLSVDNDGKLSTARG